MLPHASEYLGEAMVVVVGLVSSEQLDPNSKLTEEIPRYSNFVISYV